MNAWLLALVALAAAVALAVVLARAVRGRDRMGTQADLATYRTLHVASQAAPYLRGGLTTSAAQGSVKHLRTLLGVDAVAITDRFATLAWDGAGERHGNLAVTHAADTLDTGATTMIGADSARAISEILKSAVSAPLTSDDVVIGALVAYSVHPAGPPLARAVEEVAAFASGQLDLAELDRTRARSAEAEVRALRAQISPHFIFNSLTAIASFVRTDPDRARELLLDFAEFTRYSFRSHGRYTTLAEELRSIEQYLLLEQARFGDRLQVKLRIDPEVLGVKIPFLCIQPLVENAVRHGLERSAEGGTIVITAKDRGATCLITIEDDGVGNDPAVIRRSLSGEPGDHVGLANVDERLRTAFGDDHGLVVETGPEAGTKVTMVVPKFAEAVQLA
ncbi:MAG: two-component system, LytTR family, sensor kinase [Actinomycetota bacterium]|nr:two-component system, LytTR family, sensor kinase [Actinomycetota bacterium]